MTSDAEVRAALEQSLGRAIAVFDRRGSEYQTSFALAEIDVELDDGTRLELMFKDVGDTGLDEKVRAAKPAFLYDPRRELAAYRDVLAPAGLGTPRLYGADEERGWLFLERVRGVELYQVGPRSTWEHVARWLGRMHALLASAAGRVPTAIRHDRAFYLQWPERAVAFADDETRPLLERVAAGYDAVADRLLALAPTVLHGEFYASNVLVDHPDTPARVAPVDWEQMGVGPGVVDLAALTAGNWSSEDRREIAAAYRRACDVDFDDEALDAARVHLAVQWLGWSAEWTPPEEHRQDWLGEALAAAGRLGLSV